MSVDLRVRPGPSCRHVGTIQSNGEIMDLRRSDDYADAFDNRLSRRAALRTAAAGSHFIDTTV